MKLLKINLYNYVESWANLNVFFFFNKTFSVLSSFVFFLCFYGTLSLYSNIYQDTSCLLFSSLDIKVSRTRFMSFFFLTYNSCFLT